MSLLPRQSKLVGAVLRPTHYLVIAAALAVSGCSAGLGRFDFPAMGYSGSGAEPKLDRTPPAPVYGNQGAIDQGYGAPGYSSPYSSNPAPANPYASRTAPPTYNGGSGYGSTAGGQLYSQPYGTSTQVARLPDPAPVQGSSPRYEVYSNSVDGGAIDSTRGTPVGNAGGGRRTTTSSRGDTDLRRDTALRGETVTVRQGDTLYSIAREHGTTIAALRNANNLNSSSLQIGQKLVLPGNANSTARLNDRAPRQAETRRVADAAPLDDNTANDADQGGSSGAYVVRQGDSLYGIARQLGVRSSDLARANGITDPAKLKVGQRLTVPGGATGSTTVIADEPQPRVSRRVAALDTEANDASAQSTGQYDADQEASTETYSNDQVASLPSTNATNPEDMRFRWPVRGRVVKSFGAGSDGKHNDGIDIAVPLGTEVQAAEDGVVAYAGSELKGYGNLILIRHQGDWVTAYAHNEKLLVSRGDKIKRGQAIAKAGRSGSVERPQLHFEVRKGSMPVDPLKYMASN